MPILYIPLCALESETLNFLPFMMFVSCWRNCTAQGLQSERICNSTRHWQRDLLYNFRSPYLQRKPWSPVSSTVVWKFDALRSIGQNSHQNDQKRKTKMICDVIPIHVYWFLFMTHPYKTVINLRSYLLYLISLVTQLVYYTVGKWESAGVFTTEYNILVEKLGSSHLAVLNVL